MRKIVLILITVFMINICFAITVETEPGNENNYSVTTMKTSKGEVIMDFYYYDFSDGFEYVKQLKTKAFDDVEKVKIDGKGKSCIVYGVKENKKISKKVKLDFKKNIKKIRQ